MAIASRTQDEALEGIQDRYGVLSEQLEYERKQLGLTYAQAQVYFDSHPFRVVHAGRRWGKSTLALSEALRAAQTVLGGHIAYITPSLDMARFLAWKPLKRAAALPESVVSFRDSDMTMTFAATGTTVRVYDASAIDVLRGEYVDFAVFDEAADCPVEVWTDVVRPNLTSRGEAIFLGTRVGWTARLLQEVVDDSKRWGAFHYSTIEGGLLTDEQLVATIKGLPDELVKSEFLL
jgi:hypothetical protein